MPRCMRRAVRATAKVVEVGEEAGGEAEEAGRGDPPLPVH